MASLRYHSNQLKFNVDLPPTREKAVQLFHRPSPVLFEKLRATPNTTFCQEPAPQVNVVFCFLGYLSVILKLYQYMLIRKNYIVLFPLSFDLFRFQTDVI